MGYFPNGSSGMDYQVNLCEKCAHFGPADGPGCPVMALHMSWNYEANRDKTKAKALETFIPRDKDGYNERCKMFVPLEHLTETGKDILTEAERAAKEQQRLAEWNQLYRNQSIQTPERKAERWQPLNNSES